MIIPLRDLFLNIHSALTIKYTLHPHSNPLLNGEGALKRLR